MLGTSECHIEQPEVLAERLVVGDGPAPGCFGGARPVGAFGDVEGPTAGNRVLVNDVPGDCRTATPERWNTNDREFQAFGDEDRHDLYCFGLRFHLSGGNVVLGIVGGRGRELVENRQEAVRGRPPFCGGGLYKTSDVVEVGDVPIAVARAKHAGGHTALGPDLCTELHWAVSSEGLGPGGKLGLDLAQLLVVGCGELGDGPSEKPRQRSGP